MHLTKTISTLIDPGSDIQHELGRVLEAAENCVRALSGNSRLIAMHATPRWSMISRPAAIEALQSESKNTRIVVGPESDDFPETSISMTFNESHLEIVISSADKNVFREVATSIEELVLR